ncbi:Hsp20/alpha crystallin family protein [Paenibacillaceae bacterium]|nr:Hsp20/alpha crystallin family protein [Paenibacillaceae bacterium]
MFNLVTLHKRNDDLARQMLKQISAVFDQQQLAPLHSHSNSFRTDIHEKDDVYLIEAELPGVRKDDINIELNGSSLVIRATRSRIDEPKDEQGKVIRRERSHGEFARRFYVKNIEEDGIRAKLEDGILQLTVPKKVKPAEQVKRIGIE